METREQKLSRKIILNRWRNERKASVFDTKLFNLTGFILSSDNCLSLEDSYEQLYLMPEVTSPTLQSPMTNERDFESNGLQLLKAVGDRDILLRFCHHEYIGLIKTNLSWLIQNLLTLMKLDGDAIYVRDGNDSEQRIWFDFGDSDRYYSGYQILVNGDLLQHKILNEGVGFENWEFAPSNKQIYYQE